MKCPRCGSNNVKDEGQATIDDDISDDIYTVFLASCGDCGAYGYAENFIEEGELKTGPHHPDEGGMQWDNYS